MRPIYIPHDNELPENVHIPNFHGRVLIGGKLRTDVPYKTVMSPCWLKRRGSDELYAPEIGQTPNVTTEIFGQAVDAAIAAWSQGTGEWPTARMEERINAVISFRDRMLKQRELVSKLLMWEIAKPWTDSLAEFDRTIKYIDDTVEATKQLDRDCARMHFSEGIMAQIRRAPLGVTLCMGPFNYPLNETFTTLIPALIMGNTVIVKIPRWGQLLWEPLLEAFHDCFPPGVVNIINGLGRAIIADSIHAGKIDTLAFIGSSAVANKIKLSHPRPHRFRSILSLDAKNPAIIMPDAKIDVAVAECTRGALTFNGQRCTALKIFFVHKSIRKNFEEALVAKVESLKCGLPWELGVSITPMPDFAKAGSLREQIDEALRSGARALNPDSGGKIIGSLMTPAVVSGVPFSTRLGCNEQFGPVLPVVEYDRIEEFEDYVVQSHFGSQASFFGEDSEIIGKLIDRLSNQLCRINLNTQCQRGPDVFPFTGRKDSGEGTLSVTDALRSFSIRSMVAAKQDSSGKGIVRGVLEGGDSHFLSTDIVL